MSTSGYGAVLRWYPRRVYSGVQDHVIDGVDMTHAMLLFIFLVFKWTEERKGRICGVGGGCMEVADGTNEWEGREMR